MRRVLVILPELLGDPSVLRQKLPIFERIAEFGTVFKLNPTPKIETPEALYLGLSPNEGQLRQGPLSVSALGADPPDRSTHFHLSFMSFTDGVASQIKLEISPEEQAQVMELAKKLNTKLLTIVEGEGIDHGLVWESIGDFRTTPPSDLDGQPMKAQLPEGDAEVLLRRFIDDSINLLSEIEMNQRRVDEELPPLNLLWPWGDGIRTPIPNLALKRGEPAMVLSSSMRLQGLARLAGYRHGVRRDFGKGTNTRLASIAKTCLKEPVTIVLVDAIASFRSQGMLEESDWFAHEMDSALLKPLFEEALLGNLICHLASDRNSTRITLLAPRAEGGLGAAFETRNANNNSIPFDERALEEKALGVTNLWEGVQRAIN